MTDSLTALSTLKRPPLLVQAARHALTRYNRDRDLGHILGHTRPPSPARAVPELIDRERDLDAQRKAGQIDYDAGRHIRVLTALMGEAQALPEPAPVHRLHQV